MSNIEPLNNYVLIKIVQETVDTQQVLLPENRIKEEAQVGEVIAAPLHDEIFGKVKTGDKVIFDKDLVIHVKIKGEKNYFLRQEDILGTLHEWS